jgi:ABC-type amino acid transport substrate-binding protein
MKLTGYLPVALLLTALIVVSCGPSADDTERESAADAADLPENSFLSMLNDDELAYLEGHGDTLAFAVNQDENSYFVREDGTISGFDYHYARAMAEDLEMRAEFYLTSTVEEFFYFQGEFDQEALLSGELSYTPDLFAEVDVMAAPFAINEWRQRLMYMVPLFPVGVVLIGPDAGDVTQFQDLDGSSMAVRSGDFQVPFLQNLSETYDIAIEMREYPDEQDVFDLLRDGFADYTIDGSIFLARGMQELEDLEASPLSLSLIPVGWGISREDELLAGIIEKYVSFSLDQGILGEIWTEQNGVDFNFYLDLVGSN